MRRRDIAVLLVLLTAATADRAVTAGATEKWAEARPSATTPACPGGTFRWSGVTRETRLTEVSPVVRVGKDDGSITFRPRLVRNIVPRVDTSDDGISAHRVLVALAKRLKWWDVQVLAAPGEASADRDFGSVRIDFLGHAGRYVAAQGVRVVDAGFALDCPGGRVVYGSVTTWLKTDSGASLECGVDPRAHGIEEPWVDEAYLLTCGGKAT
ncbi:hypothetical protein AB0M32_13315 [Streptomyces sp. NPDC051985]|uniref:hypothetical protein n=1 Tax=Streptomyces sp. NPDC051985 TaxID=3155807 RepID=UPI00341B8018